jgi:hypothetical protein
MFLWIETKRTLALPSQCGQDMKIYEAAKLLERDGGYSGVFY